MPEQYTIEVISPDGSSGGVIEAELPSPLGGMDIPIRIEGARFLVKVRFPVELVPEQAE